jgi:hypothetical protein
MKRSQLNKALTASDILANVYSGTLDQIILDLEKQAVDYEGGVMDKENDAADWKSMVADHRSKIRTLIQFALDAHAPAPEIAFLCRKYEITHDKVKGYPMDIASEHYSEWCEENNVEYREHAIDLQKY